MSGSRASRLTRTLRALAGSWVLAAAFLATTPSPAAAQTRWGAAGAVGLARHLVRMGGGPALGDAGGQVQVIRESWRGPWGLSFGYRTFGTFDNPVPGDTRDESMVELGLRRWAGGRPGRPGAWITLGADLLVVREKGMYDQRSRDPGLGAVLGAGASLGPADGPAPLYVELAVHPFVATGEHTNGNGVYVTAHIGLAF